MGSSQEITLDAASKNMSYVEIAERLHVSVTNQLVWLNLNQYQILA